MSLAFVHLLCAGGRRLSPCCARQQSSVTRPALHMCLLALSASPIPKDSFRRVLPSIHASGPPHAAGLGVALDALLSGEHTAEVSVVSALAWLL